VAWWNWRHRPAAELSDEQDANAGTIFARALPSQVLLEERYTYWQRISRNPGSGRTEASTGRLHVRMPYDGHSYFTRQAAADVERQLPAREPPAAAEAFIGHLVLAEHQHTDLADRLGMSERSGSHALTVPVSDLDIGPTDLTSDRLLHSSTVTYEPGRTRPALVPVRLDVELADPDNGDTMTAADVRKVSKTGDGKHLEVVADAIKRYIAFLPFLRLEIVARITLPASEAAAPTPPPVVRRVAVELPSTMSLATTSVQLLVRNQDHPLQLEPTGHLLAWADVQTHLDEAPSPESPRSFLSDQMTLHFHQPGELFQQQRIVVEAEVEIPELLSGTEARLFDSRGYRSDGTGGPLLVRSIVRTRCTVTSSDLFSQRIVSPYQSFHFDEIVPDALRLADIQAVLVDQRFTIVLDYDLTRDSSKRLMRRLIIAERADGPDVLRLLVLVEGRRHTTQRESRHPGGHRYTSKFPSGDIAVFVRGEVPRDARTAVHEINDLQLALRERFQRLRAQR
jgi:hypothetical protein